MPAVWFDLEKIKQKDQRELNLVANAMVQKKLTPGQVGLLKHQGKEVMPLIRQMVDAMRQTQEVAFKANSYTTTQGFQAVENISRSRRRVAEDDDPYPVIAQMHKESLRSNERLNESNNTTALIAVTAVTAVAAFGFYFATRKK